jgi:hypothetical protein
MAMVRPGRSHHHNRTSTKLAMGTMFTVDLKMEFKRDECLVL